MSATVEPKTTLISKSWAQFEANVLNPAAPDVQRREMKLAFYAGAHTTLQMLQQLGESNVDEEAGVNVLMGCVTECEDFIKQLTEKR